MLVETLRMVIEALVAADGTRAAAILDQETTL
jgi:hypothetical protein